MNFGRRDRRKEKPRMSGAEIPSNKFLSQQIVVPISSKPFEYEFASAKYIHIPMLELAVAG